MWGYGNLFLGHSTRMPRRVRVVQVGEEIKHRDCQVVRRGF